MRAKSLQLCLTLSDPMDGSLMCAHWAVLRNEHVSYQQVRYRKVKKTVSWVSCESWRRHSIFSSCLRTQYTLGEWKPTFCLVLLMGSSSLDRLFTIWLRRAACPGAADGEPGCQCCHLCFCGSLARLVTQICDFPPGVLCIQLSTLSELVY